ncbi:MAG: hypothetical protein CMH34_06565 [Microbacterium sp.]|nr:hypothetical protein [Microbacterium sp.]
MNVNPDTMYTPAPRIPSTSALKPADTVAVSAMTVTPIPTPRRTRVSIPRREGGGAGTAAG